MIEIRQLTARNGIPATYANRDYAEAGGLMSYGTNVTDSFRERQDVQALQTARSSASSTGPRTTLRDA